MKILIENVFVFFSIIKELSLGNQNC